MDTTKTSMANTAEEKASSSKRKAEWFEIDEDRNTYAYVSGLPYDTSEADFIDLMKKYGLIAKKPLPGQPFNVKLYKNEDGSFKGDALCCFVRKESVDLAITHLDGYQYTASNVLHCERAKFELKGSYDPSKKPRQALDPKSKMKQKKTINKLLSWEFGPEDDKGQRKVILKNMFAPEEIAQDATLILDLKEDVEERCTEMIAEPKRVDIFDKHPEGVVAVTFADALQAEKCVQMLDKEFYAGRVVQAELWDGKTKYKIKETDEESAQRLEKWHKDIQEDDTDAVIESPNQVADTRKVEPEKFKSEQVESKEETG